MEHSDDAPPAGEGQRGAMPGDQPLEGPAGPGDENMPARPLTPDSGEDGPHEPSPEDDRRS